MKLLSKMRIGTRLLGGFGIVTLMLVSLAGLSSWSVLRLNTQTSTKDTVQAIGEIGTVIKQVNEVSRTIASAVEEQSITTKEIARNVAGTATASETVSAGVSQSALASQEITQNIAGVEQAAHQTAAGAAQAQTAGPDLSQMAEKLQALVGEFRV